MKLRDLIKEPIVLEIPSDESLVLHPNRVELVSVSIDEYGNATRYRGEFSDRILDCETVNDFIDYFHDKGWPPPIDISEIEKLLPKRRSTLRELLAIENEKRQFDKGRGVIIKIYENEERGHLSLCNLILYPERAELVRIEIDVRSGQDEKPVIDSFDRVLDCRSVGEVFSHLHKLNGFIWSEYDAAERALQQLGLTGDQETFEDHLRKFNNFISGEAAAV